MQTEITTHPLWDRQVTLEEQMRSLGIERFREQVRKNQERDTTSKTHSGKRMLTGLHEKVVEGIEKFIEEAEGGGAGRRHSALRFVKKLDVDVVANITLRRVVDSLSHPILFTTLASNIASMLEDEVNSRLFKEAMPKAWKKFKERGAQQTIEKRKWSHLLMPAQMLGVTLEEWSEKDRILVGSKLIEIVVETTGIIAITLMPEGKMTKHMVAVTPEALDWMEQENSRLEWLCPVLLPTLVPPKPWTTPYSGGYWTKHIREMTLVKTRNKEYLQELASRDMPEVYAAVNALQETAWAINTPVLEVMETLWQTGSEIAGLPRADNLPMPPKAPWMEEGLDKETLTEEQQLELKEWKTKAFLVYDTNAKLRGKRVSLMGLLRVARMFRDEEAMYFPHQLDWRGRAYPTPLYLHPQGDDRQRGLLTFASTVPILDQDAADWLAIHGAGIYGEDKCSLQDRVAWVYANEAEIIASARDPYSNRFWTTADKGTKPWSFLAFCFEWAAFRAHGFGYESSLPIQMDGTCNGLQNFSAMLLDEVGGAAVNLIPNPEGKPKDIYQAVADIVNVLIEKDAQEGNELALGWLGNVTRKVTKRPVMTLAYGSRQYGFTDQILEDTINPWKETSAQTYPFMGSRDGKEWDNGFAAAQYLAKHIWQAVGEVVVAARQAMDWLQEAARTTASNGLPIFWSTPDGFLVAQAYRVPNMKRVETTFERTRISMRYSVGEGKLDSRRQASGISPNWVHSLDATHLRRTINAAHEEGIRSFSMIHDSYGTHAGNAVIMAAILREQFVQMYAEVDVLGTFKADLEEQMDGQMLPDLPPKGDLDLTQVLSSPFFFA
jgi:DNA-directed RNA polymerase